MRSTLTLYVPAKPRSAVTTTSAVVLTGRTLKSGCSISAAAPAMLDSTSVIFFAYGLAACARTWARRSLAAATISMALKICCMLRVERMRRRRSFSDAIGSGLEPGLERLAAFVQALLVLVGHLLRGAHVVRHLGVLLLHERQPLALETPHRRDRQVVQVAVGPGRDRDDLVLDRHGDELALLQELDHALAAGDLGLRRLVEVRAELRERGERPVLCEVEAQAPGHLAHRLDLGVAAHARHGDA